MNSFQMVKKQITRYSQEANRTQEPLLVAVSKMQTIEKILEVYHQGQRVFGENYVQELIEKKQKLEAEGFLDFDFQFIGKLQSNKVKILLPHVRTLHSVDSLKLLLEIEKRAAEIKKEIQVYLQINISREDSKSGFLEEVIPTVLEELGKLKWLKCIGLMAIPNPDLPSDEAFLKMKVLSEKYQGLVGSGLSMGMTHDFESAIKAGSTCLRIGSGLFGARK